MWYQLKSDPIQKGVEVDWLPPPEKPAIKDKPTDAQSIEDKLDAHGKASGANGYRGVEYLELLAAAEIRKLRVELAELRESRDACQAALAVILEDRNLGANAFFDPAKTVPDPKADASKWRKVLIRYPKTGVVKAVEIMDP